MSIRLIVTRGFGNGTFNGSITDVVTRGYTIGEEIIIGAKYTEYIQAKDTIMEVRSKITEMAKQYKDTTMVVR